MPQGERGLQVAVDMEFVRFTLEFLHVAVAGV